MLTNLLKDRFKLVAHTESRELPIFNLLLSRADGKLGPSLKPTSPECLAEMQARRAGRRREAREAPEVLAGLEVPEALDAVLWVRRRPRLQSAIAVRLDAHRAGLGNASGQPIAQIVQLLSQFTGRPVYDKTGLTGQYDFDLKWAPESGSGVNPFGGPPPGAQGRAAVDPDAPNIYTAVQEQLGLKLENAKVPVDVDRHRSNREPRWIEDDADVADGLGRVLLALPIAAQGR
jgi:uncharacterized protein (TIGR03435 family)